MKMPKMKKKFNGKTYNLHASTGKKDAMRVKRELKADGHKARITKTKNTYNVWKG